MVAKVASKHGSVVTSVIVKGEILYGLNLLPLGKRRADLEAKAASIFATVTAEPVTETVLVHYAATRSALEKRGFLLGDNDLWIAVTALSIGATLVTRDQDFRHVPGLMVEDWTI